MDADILQIFQIFYKNFHEKEEVLRKKNWIVSKHVVEKSPKNVSFQFAFFH